MKKFLSFLATKGHTKERFEALDAEKQADLQNEYLGTIEEQLEKAQSKEDAKAELEKAKKELKEELAKEVANQLLEQTSKGSDESKTLVEEIKEKKDEIKSIANGDKNTEVEIKALSNRASIANNTEAVRLSDIGQLGVKRRALYDFFPKVQVGNGNHNGAIA